MALVASGAALLGTIYTIDWIVTLALPRRNGEVVGLAFLPALGPFVQIAYADAPYHGALAASGVLQTIGLSALIAGAVLWRRPSASTPARARSPSLRPLPLLGPTISGVGMMGRF